MNKKEIFKFLLGITLSLFCVLSYQNCSKLEVDSNNALFLSAVGNCELAPMVFEQVYQEFLQTECGVCHKANGSGNGEFGDTDLMLAFNAFSLRGSVVITERALNPNHQAGITGLHHKDRLDEINKRWGDWDSCLQSSKSESPAIDGADSLKLQDKYILAGKNKKELEWDLGEDSSNPNYKDIKFKISVSLYETSDGLLSYEFSNPRILTQENAIFIGGIEFYINQQLISSATTLKFLKLPIASNQNIQLVSISNVIEMSDIRSQDQISFKINNIKIIDDFDPTNPPDVGNGGPIVTQKYSDLIANNGVFKLYCISCHNNSKADGGLDMTNYNQLINEGYIVANDVQSSSLLRRMKDSNNPMPRSGVLDEELIKKVESWVLDGAKNN